MRVVGGPHLWVMSLRFLQGRREAEGWRVADAPGVFWFPGFGLCACLVSLQEAGLSERTLVRGFCSGARAHQLRGSRQACVFGHAVEQPLLLQELGRWAVLSHFPFVQHNHPAGGGHGDVRGRAGLGSSCAEAPAQAPAVCCQDSCGSLLLAHPQPLLIVNLKFPGGFLLTTLPHVCTGGRAGIEAQLVKPLRCQHSSSECWLGSWLLCF